MKYKRRQTVPSCITQINGIMDVIQGTLDRPDELCLEERGIYETTPSLYFLSPPP